MSKEPLKLLCTWSNPCLKWGFGRSGYSRRCSPNSGVEIQGLWFLIMARAEWSVHHDVSAPDQDRWLAALESHDSCSWMAIPSDTRTPSEWLNTMRSHSLRVFIAAREQSALHFQEKSWNPRLWRERTISRQNEKLSSWQLWGEWTLEGQVVDCSGIPIYFIDRFLQRGFQSIFCWNGMLTMLKINSIFVLPARLFSTITRKPRVLRYTWKRAIYQCNTTIRL